MRKRRPLAGTCAYAGVAELVDAPDLGSGDPKSWGFESLRPHHPLERRASWGVALVAWFY
jgi:hypothetical protein